MVNASLETAGPPVMAEPPGFAATASVPRGWMETGYGRHWVRWERTHDAHSGRWALRVTVTHYVSGAAELTPQFDLGAWSLPVTAGSAYQSRLGLRGIRVSSPTDADAATIDRVIFEELVRGTIRDESRDEVRRIVERLADAGCGGVVMACSESELMLDASESPLPLYDAADLLAQGTIRQIAGPIADA